MLQRERSGEAAMTNNQPLRTRKAAVVQGDLLLLLLLGVSGCAASIGDRWARAVCQCLHPVSRHCPIGLVPLCKRAKFSYLHVVCVISGLVALALNVVWMWSGCGRAHWLHSMWSGCTKCGRAMALIVSSKPVPSTAARSATAGVCNTAEHFYACWLRVEIG